jgi:hypothetical protein
MSARDEAREAVARVLDDSYEWVPAVCGMEWALNIERAIDGILALPALRRAILADVAAQDEATAGGGG